MTSSGWIISHRCCWITVYVLCCNAQVNLIVILMTFECFLYSINCQTVICLPSMLFILWRDTSRELWTPVHSFTFLLPFTIYSHYLHSRKLLLPPIGNNCRQFYTNLVQSLYYVPDSYFRSEGVSFTAQYVLSFVYSKPVRLTTSL
jgi:hypothetical protein